MSVRLWAGSKKGVFTLERQKNTWTIASVAFLGDHAVIVFPDARDGSVYAAFDHGHFGAKLHRSPDGGKSWEEIAAPAYPEKPEDVPDVVNPMTGKAIPWKLVLIWALEAKDPKKPGSLWAGTIPGGLFSSDDAGKSWQLARSLWDDPQRQEWFGGGKDLPGIHSICVDPRDANHVNVGVSCGGVWKTRDGGATWQCSAKGMWAAYMPPEQKDNPNIQDPHRVVQCPGNPDHLWAQHHNGVFRTTDGATTWHDVTTVQPSVFGFAVAVHPRDPKIAWTVPAIKDERRTPVDGKVVVARTRDGGASFEVLRQGLPQDHAYDLVYRHALDVDPSGDVLAFGSTTGSLWVTENQGDSWQSVSEHLPPINCVRFG